MKNLKDCIDSCLACLTTCENCITDCVAGDNRACILLCRDCADICALCARFEARDSQFVHGLHALCAEICKACAVECEKHAAHHETCKACAKEEFDPVTDDLTPPASIDSSLFVLIIVAVVLGYVFLNRKLKNNKL